MTCFVKIRIFDDAFICDSLDSETSIIHTLDLPEVCDTWIQQLINKGIVELDRWVDLMESSNDIKALQKTFQVKGIVCCGSDHLDLITNYLCRNSIVQNDAMTVSAWVNPHKKGHRKCFSFPVVNETTARTTPSVNVFLIQEKWYTCQYLRQMLPCAVWTRTDGSFFAVNQDWVPIGGSTDFQSVDSVIPYNVCHLTDWCEADLLYNLNKLETIVSLFWSCVARQSLHQCLNTPEALQEMMKLMEAISARTSYCRKLRSNKEK